VSQHLRALKDAQHPAAHGMLTIDAPVDRVFRTFTDGFGSWWPAEYHIGQADMAIAILEPREGGRWYEQGTDGSECDGQWQLTSS